MLNRKQKNKEKNHLSKINSQYRRKFFINLNKICILYAGYDMYSLFPPHALEVIYEKRIRGIKALKGDGNISSNDLKFIDRMIMTSINNFYIPNKNGESIPLGLQMIEGLSLVSATMDYVGHEFVGVKKVIEATQNYGEDSPFFVDFILTINQMLFVTSLFLGDYGKGIIYGQFNLELWQNTGRISNVVRFTKVTPKVKHFVVDNKPRPAQCVCWAFPDHAVLIALLKPSQLGIIDDQDLPMEVYIQSHAIKRLEERIGPHLGLLHYLVFENITNVRIPVHLNGKILVDYYYLQQKAGYLVCSVIDNAVFIHTFLFLTHTGTPEGKRLTKLTGFQKTDVKYLAIDKLSTFLSYNIQGDDFAKEIFLEAGCGPLFKLGDMDKSLSTKSKSNVDVIVKYLMANHNHTAVLEKE